MGRTQRVLLSAVLATAAPGAFAADDATVTPRIERVALFKNGLAYFVSSVTLPDKATQVTLGSLPVPVLGAFWATYPKTVAVKGLYTRMVDAADGVPAVDFPRLLAANVGRKATISGAQDMPPVEGVIVSAGPSDRQQDVQNPYVMDGRRPEGYPPLPILRTSRGLVAVNPHSIHRVDFEDPGARASVVARVPAVRVELEKAAPGEKLGLGYLAKGITWSPSYLIDLSDPKTARLTASALVVNEIADLDGVKLELVTGFPNIRFANVTSPIAMTQTLAQFLSDLRNMGSRQPETDAGIFAQQTTLSNVASFERAGRAPAYSVAAPGDAAEDLFLYPIEAFSLKRGETAYLPLFSVETPYEHIYTWKIPDFLDDNERYRRDTEAATEEVWHSCRLTNPLKMPLTTAPAQFVKDGRFTGQDVSYYTAPGAETTIRINRAMNVVAEQGEFEVERKPDEARFNGNRYDLVAIRGELKLRNRMDKPASVEVSKDLSGTVTATEPPAKDTASAKGLRRVNPRHVLVWKLELGPGEERKLTYNYTVYIRD